MDEVTRKGLERDRAATAKEFRLFSEQLNALSAEQFAAAIQHLRPLMQAVRDALAQARLS